MLKCNHSSCIFERRQSLGENISDRRSSRETIIFRNFHNSYLVSNCVVKKRLDKYFTSVEIFELICKYTIMKIWKFDAKKMLSVELISQFSSSRNVLTSNFDFFFPMSVEITVAVEPYEGLGDIQLKVGLN